MKNKNNPNVLELAQKETLKSIYLINKQTPEYHHTTFTISREISRRKEYGSIRNSDVTELLQPFIESGLVHESINSQVNHPFRPQQITKTYQANLEREDEILKLINSTSKS